MRKWWDQNRHLFDAYLWWALTIPAFLWWKESIFYLIVVSHYANYKTAIGAHEGRKARKNTEDDNG